MANMANDPQEVGKTFTRHDHRGRPFGVRLTWALIGRELKVVSVEISARDGVDASMVRDLPLRSVADQERPRMATVWRMHLDRPELSEADRKHVRAVLAAARAPRDDPELLELIAETYKAAYRKGVPPTKAVHEKLLEQGHELSRQQVGKLVMRCRQVGLLGPAEPRRGGEQPRRRKGAGK
jgi:hypothetical protein